MSFVFLTQFSKLRHLKLGNWVTSVEVKIFASGRMGVAEAQDTMVGPL